MWRIQRQPRLEYKRYPSPRHRFDAGGGQYAVTYTNNSWLGVFAEVYADRRGRRLDTEDGEYRLARLSSERPLALLDLRSNATLSVLDLDARISTGDDYEACQQWALAIYEATKNIDGLKYAPRKAGERFSNVALFPERCAASLTCEDQGALKDLEKVVLAAREEYRLNVTFLT